MIRETISGYYKGNLRGVFAALLLSNALSVVLFLARATASGNMRYWFLLWNLLLSWLPLLLAWWLTVRLRTQLWLTPANVLITGLWLVILPNSFYLISDFIHLHESGEVSLLYDVAMFFSFIFNALVLGYMSIVVVHAQLLRRVRSRDAHGIVASVFLLCGLAIYLGRYLRWNSWDIVVNPAGILFDLSEGVVNPTSHPEIFSTTLVFALLLGVMYIVVWQMVVALVGPKHKK